MFEMADRTLCIIMGGIVIFGIAISTASLKVTGLWDALQEQDTNEVSDSEVTECVNSATFVSPKGILAIGPQGPCARSSVRIAAFERLRATFPVETSTICMGLGLQCAYRLHFKPAP